MRCSKAQWLGTVDKWIEIAWDVYENGHTWMERCGFCDNWQRVPICRGCDAKTLTFAWQQTPICGLPLFGDGDDEPAVSVVNRFGEAYESSCFDDAEQYALEILQWLHEYGERHYASKQRIEVQCPHCAKWYSFEAWWTDGKVSIPALATRVERKT